MGIKIHQLPPAVANQIAAGEVIERPASVVKELLENSLDAGANTISIELSYGGLNQIKISDNGSGIDAEDLPLAIAAHATSKITKLDDLYAIDSMGFRGEALASIASIAKVTISSKTEQQEHAMMMRVQGAEITLTPCARTVGTTIDVVDLFFNAPVRKRFLKGEKLEFQAIEAVVKRFALSAPKIALVLKHNGKEVLSLPAAVSEQAKITRMTKIFGSAFMNNAIYMDVELANMRLYGWLSNHEYQRSQNDKQWVYVNNRMVKDKLINHALKQAYDGVLHPGRFPSCLLYFTINPAEVDINVHPTKHEVRFQQPRLIHDFFTSQLSKFLTAKPQLHANDYFIPELLPIPPLVRLSEPSAYVNHLAPSDLLVQTVAQEPISYESFNNSRSYNKPVEANARPLKNSRMQALNSEVYAESHWTVLNERYIVVFLQQKTYLVDVIMLQQQWLQKELQHVTLPLDSRPLLVPVHYPCPAKLAHRQDKFKTIMKQLGIQAELSSTGILLIRSIPIKIPYVDLRLFLDAVAELECLEPATLIILLCQSQTVDPKYLSMEERMMLNQFLLEVLNQQTKVSGLFKLLTVDDCRMLLHA